MDKSTEAKLVIEHYKSFSLLLSELSDEYEKEPAVKFITGKYSKAIFNSVKRTATTFGLKEKLKKSKLYKQLYKKGVMDLLNR